MQASELEKYGYIVEGSRLVSYVGKDSTIMLPADITEIGERAFAENPTLEAVVIPRTVEVIGDGAFAYCPKLKYVSIGEGVRKMGRRVFANCKCLESAEFRGSLEEIPPETFADCENLGFVFPPSGMIRIGEGAFRDCYHLRTIEIWDTVKEIDSQAFWFSGPVIRYHGTRWNWWFGVNKGKNWTEGRKKVEFVHPPKKEKKHSSDPFVRTLEGIGATIDNMLSVTSYWGWAAADYLPFDVIYDEITADTLLSKRGLAISDAVASIDFEKVELNASYIAVQPGNPTYHSVDNALIETATGKLLLVGADAVIPQNAGIKVLAGNAIHSGAPTTIRIPEGVEVIEQTAIFSLKDLTLVTIPRSVTAIAPAAIYQCANLTSLIVEGGNPRYHSKNNCIIETATGKLVLGGKDCIIPDDGSVKEIGDFAFTNWEAIREITIPTSVEKIGKGAFALCGSFTDLSYPGTIEAWGAIERDPEWKSVEKVVVHCSDGDVEA